MVKLTFNSALGQKDLKKEEKDEALIPHDLDVEDVLRVRQQSRAWCWCMCLGLALILSGVVVGGAYLYRYYFIEEERMYFCGVNYREENYKMQDSQEDTDMDLPAAYKRIEEKVRVLEDEGVELINIPVPKFSDSDPADIVHDFNRRLTAYLDLRLNKCYVIPLNTSVVMPPKDFLELLVNIKAGTYLPQSYLVREQMMVTGKVEHVDQLGYFIYGLCRGRDTYKLERRETVLGIQKREALNCHKILHFENKFVVETLICEQ
ncbi:integral membrane protein 2Ba [Danio rerio]|uniref:Integral membrane protein 2 n=2 Tax=Bilateria TaxID=33213 RepID=Q803H7_DANRE|nr:integral membrane protein 2Ba [Danio rerio]AAH44480.1 Integral membrane protein 2Ba [Danio rerio]AAI28820.1 Itm2ba protein [Danio rerio]AAI64594.1 Itm2ba protein [Danio rerio]|eukprot:NP_955940.1 integral membrane protein 2B [Danio rerio]